MRTFVLLLFSALTLRAQSPTFTLDHYANVARVTDLRVAPQGDRAVVVVAWPNYETNAWESEIVQIDFGTRATRTLTQRKTASAPRWSPNGDRLAFLATVEGRNQIFVMPVSGGDARQVTRSPTSVGAFAWRPDGAAFAFTAAPASEVKGKFDDAFEVSDNDYLALATPRPTHVWTVPAEGGEIKALARGPWSVPGLANSVIWSPDGRTVVFPHQPGPGSRLWEKRSLVSAEASTGSLSALQGLGELPCGQPAFSPDGAHLLVTCPLGDHQKNQAELRVIPARGGPAQRLTASIDRNLSRGVWTSDSKTIVTSGPDGTRSGLWEIPLGGAPRRRDVGRINVDNVDVTPNGTIVFIGNEAQRPAEVYRLAPGATAPERLTEFHAVVARLSLGAVEAMTWKSDDGLPLSGVLTFPPGFDPARKYPLLLNIHGGPWGSSRETFSTRNQLLASKGFIVFEPNYRGSDNHGNALYAAVYRDHGAGPGRDVMAGLAILKQRAYVDTTRIGVSGWSYGGYMTTWLIGHYGGWKAAMAGAAVIDLIDDYNLQDLSIYKRAYGETLSFPADLKLMTEQSPMTYVDQMKTPLLLLSNTGDVRVPVTQSYTLYHALKERGRDVRLKLWPVPGHFPADPYRARDIDREWAEYFVERLGRPIP